MTSSPGPDEVAARRIDALTGLRFVAAAVVLLEHFPQVIPGLDVEAAAQGGAGVSLFFVLSGFVLVHNYGDRLALRADRRVLRRYVVARFARLVPLHLLALAVVVPLVIALRNPFDEHPAPAVLVGLVANVLLLQAWFPIQVFGLWNGPAWSISAEAFFYVMFPVLVPVLVWPLLRRRWLGRSIVVVLAVQAVAFITVSLVVAQVLLDRGRDVDGVRLVTTRIANFPALRVAEFIAGCLIGAAYRAEHRQGAAAGWRWLERPGRRLALLCGSAVVLVVIQLTPTCPASACYPEATTARALIDLRLFVVYAPVACVVVAAVAWGPSLVSAWLERPWMVRLGEASYALYILQWSAWLIVNDGDDEPSWLVAMAAVGVMIVLSLLANKCVELPARRWLLARWSDPTVAERTGVAPSTGR